jgi:membrane protease subunit HflC
MGSQKMNKTNLSIIGLILLTIIIIGSSFTVYETDQAVILRFKKLLAKDNKSLVYSPGLHFKVPLIDEVRYFDMRLNVLSIKDSRITTIEKKDVMVNYYILWQISDIDLYFKRTQGIRSKVEPLLEQKVNAILKIEFGRLTIVELVSGERHELMQRLRETADESGQGLGLKVLDVRVKRIDLPAEVSSSVYSRMRAERERSANEFRADGEKQATWIRAEASKKYNIILAEAAKSATIIRGEGDAQAMRIYSEAFNKDPNFYAFQRSLEAYKESFKSSGDNVMVVKPDSEFFKFFNKVD